MKALLSFCLLSFILMACTTAVEPLYPVGSVPCSKDPDCLEGQYCGFVVGYAAAVCKGTPLSRFHNLQ